MRIDPSADHARHEEMLIYRDELEALAHKVVSQWLYNRAPPQNLWVLSSSGLSPVLPSICDEFCYLNDIYFL